jgi:hypothetical protein
MPFQDAPHDPLKFTRERSVCIASRLAVAARESRSPDSRGLRLMPDALCAFCSRANRAGSRFCNECGAALKLKPCTVCEAPNDRTASNCHKCGAPFATQSAITVSGAPDIQPVPMSPQSTTLVQEAPGVTLLAGTRASRPRRTAAIIALGAFAVAAAAYYAYRTAAPVAFTATPEPTSPSHALERLGNQDIDASTANVPAPTETTPNTETAKSALNLPSTDDGNVHDASARATPKTTAVTSSDHPTQPRAQTATPRTAAAVAASRQSEKPTDSTREDSAKPTIVPRTPVQPSPPGAFAGFRPPANCTEGIASLALCNRINRDEGK